MDEKSYQDGIIAKYIISKGLPGTIKINLFRLAKYMAIRLPENEIARMSKEERIDLSRKGYTRALWYGARTPLRTAVVAQKVDVNGVTYSAKRVEGSYPGFEIVLEREGLEENGTH